jgi:branched-chain amino acid transport system substrate-binding protein
MVDAFRRTSMKGLFLFLGFVLSCMICGSVLAVEPIRVGLATSLSGKYQKFGAEQSRGLKMWAEDINERGALLGRPIELIIYDNQSDRETCARLYEKLITEDKVDLLVGPYSSGMTLAARPVVEKYNFPLMVEGTAPSIWSPGVKNMFGFFTPSEKLMESVISLAADQGLIRVALAYAGTDFPQGVARGVREQVAQYGMQLVLDEEYNKDYKNSSEFKPLVERMMETRPDVVIVASYLVDAIAFTRQAKSSGLEPKILAFSGGPSLREFGDTLGSDAEGVISTVQWKRSQRMPGSFDFAFRFRQKYGKNASYNAAGGYAAGQILEAAARLAGSVDKDRVREQLATLKFRSLIGHFRVDENGKQVGKPNYVLQWQKGQRRLIHPENLARFRIVYPFPSWKGRQVPE